MKSRHLLLAATAMLTLLGACATPGGAAPEATAVSPARALHERLITLDTHLDTPANLEQPGFDIAARNDWRRGSQVDLPRMIEGGLDGGFWVVFTPQGPLTPEAYKAVRDKALRRAVATREMVAAHSDTMELALTAADGERIHAAGKRIVYQSIENSYPLGEDLSLLTTFYRLGVRMVGPVHTSNNQFADSSTDKNGPKWGGLSPLGKELVREANRLGMVLDASHASDAVLDQMIDLSATPLILSHSGVWDVYNHPRNVPDALLKKLADKGGVIQMNALGRYLRDIPEVPGAAAAMAALREKYPAPDTLSAEAYNSYLDERAALGTKYAPPLDATFEDFMEQMLHALKLMGPDHVGIGADWDGGGGVEGMRDIAALPLVTERLLKEGYTEEDLRKIWGGNVLRLVKAAEDHAASAR